MYVFTFPDLLYSCAAIVMVPVLSGLRFSTILRCSVMHRLAVAILACFTARRWRLAVPLLQAGAWRQFWRGQAVAPVFASFFAFLVIVAWVVRHQCYNGFCI